jgi:hypothetical protein
MRFLFIGPPVSSSLPPPGRLPFQSWLQVIVLSHFHVTVLLQGTFTPFTTRPCWAHTKCRRIRLGSSPIHSTDVRSRRYEACSPIAFAEWNPMCFWMRNRPCADATREAPSRSVSSDETGLWLLHLGSRHSRKQQWLPGGRTESWAFAARNGNLLRRAGLAIFHSYRHFVHPIGRPPHSTIPEKGFAHRTKAPRRVDSRRKAPTQRHASS